MNHERLHALSFAAAATLWFAWTEGAAQTRNTATATRDTVAISGVTFSHPPLFMSGYTDPAEAIYYPHQAYDNGQTIETRGGLGWIGLSINNRTAQPLQNVEYRVTSQTARFDSGLLTAAGVDAAPGLRYVQVPWLVSAGNHTFTVALDPRNRLNETESVRRNNLATLALTFLIMDTERANISTIQPSVPTSAMFAVLGTGGATGCGAGGITAAGESVYLALHRPLPTQVPDGSCWVRVELFKNVRVGNGWSFGKVQITGGLGEVTWDIQPNGASLHGQLRGSYPVGVGMLNIVVGVDLKGPPGTAPTLTYPVPGLQLR